MTITASEEFLKKKTLILTNIGKYIKIYQKPREMSLQKNQMRLFPKKYKKTTLYIAILLIVDLYVANRNLIDIQIVYRLYSIKG